MTANRNANVNHVTLIYVKYVFKVAMNVCMITLTYMVLSFGEYF